MRKFVLTAFVFSLILITGQKAFCQEAVTAGNNLATVSWEETTFNFGNIDQGTPVTYDFKFKNTADVPLVISNVKASCGCTATNYPKGAIKPGESAAITATYNAKAKGSFTKTLTVYTNTENSVQVLTIKGSVQ